MANEDDRVWITYNGEIYNHAALRPGLEAAGHRYRTRSDTETILHLYEEEGERCVERLQGMFAFALWDQTRERLLLARDRLGIKPLYYAVTDRELLFGSEIKAILAGMPGRPALNVAAVPEFLATRYVAGEETFFQGIRKLPPGHTLVWSRAGGPRRRRYWSLPVGTDDGSGSLAERARRPARAAGGHRPQPSHERRAARPLPVGRPRLDRPRGPDGAHGARAAPDLRGRLRRRREQRAPLRAPGRAGGGRAAPRGHGLAGGLLRRPPAADLARGRADRVPVEHRALLRLAAGPAPRQGRPHRAKAPTSCSWATTGTG